MCRKHICKSLYKRSRLGLPRRCRWTGWVRDAVSPASGRAQAVGTVAPFRRAASGSVRRCVAEIAAEHAEEPLPVPLGRGLVVSAFAQRECEAVLGAGIPLEPVVRSRSVERGLDLGDD